ncbi:unnamed protein product [Spirodela intermedia]|uniref:Hydrophobic seed protein domain-containing protein n=2 Tax=Spirodela intermedia TaxID=51605 RepID=A0A7I8KY67_SPIIN|nr:unnamed protein product [Spirodela intermedia]CAA2625891.1 unnamed protein product [Spirodela intermedia]CAA2625892.1 unnamed protein product [Spirodela intermedia]CAA6665226.1 unnamed protein product [Spirodela intermedia]CAA6665227.1 unnamed protein product [Spirodela intermedia]
MATKTQAIAAFLLFNLMFCTFASGQLLSLPVLKCVSKTLELITCGVVLNLIKIGGLTEPLNATCCALFSALTGDQAAQCLCAAIKINLLGLNVSVPGDIGLILTSCGKPVPVLSCP